MSNDLYRLDEGGKLHIGFHRGQGRAWRSRKRIVAILAGKQAGKTTFGPPWLWREMRRCGPGDYMVVTPTYALLRRKALPEFLRLFERYLGLGTYHQTDHIFTVSAEGQERLWGEGHDSETETRVLFGYAKDPESLASATAKAAWLDEAGQKAFKRGAYQEIQGRLAVHGGRTLVTTTLYNLGWIVQDIWRPWRQADGDHPEIEVIRFESRENPAFPDEEWERIASGKTGLPTWKFQLEYRAIPTRPAGLIYDTFDHDRDVIEPFELERGWPRYLGLDFGGVNTAALFYARPPGGGPYVLYREYRAGARTAEQHVDALLHRDRPPEHRPPLPTLAAGGSGSEDQWRREFRSAGLSLKGPQVDAVEVGIDRVYGFHAREELKVFSTCRGYLEQKQTYSRKLDDEGNPTEQIEDKHSFHFMDAERYILSHLAPTAAKGPPKGLTLHYD